MTKIKVVVVGAGIVGLSTALCCQEQDYDVVVIADKYGVNTTSHVAGGVFLPYNRNTLGSNRREDLIDVVKRSWKHYTDLYKISPKHTGIMMSFGYQCYFTKEAYQEKLPDDPLVWEVLDKYRELSTDELKKLSPASPCSGWLVQTYIIQCQYYLPYLMKRFLDQGGKFEQRNLKSFDEVPDCDVVINCSGLGAYELCNDKKVYPAKGQVSLVRAPYIKHFFHCEEVYVKPIEKRQLLYILPQTDHVILGGTYTEHDSTTLVSEEIRNDFTEKLSSVVPSLKSCEILKEECGVRPARDFIRLEVEKITLKNGRSLNVVHNYGHGGNGIALSWGTAEHAAEMASKLITKCKL